MSGKNRSRPPIGLPNIHAFRMQRHHFLDRSSAALTQVSGDVCGIQAQVMAAAEMALWARMNGLARAEISAALWEKRTLVKTSLMRQTLHLIPAEDFSLFITALRRSRVEAVLRVMARFHIQREEAFAINEIVVAALRDGRMTQGELRERIKPKVSRRVRAWMERVWSALRIPLAEGLICYGPVRGQGVTYVRADRWLPKQKAFEENEAKRVLLRRYLRAYGPARLTDFCKWSGISVKEATPVWRSLEDELTGVSFGDSSGFILRDDEGALAKCDAGERVLRLLPSFDPLLLGHAEKDHLVDAAHYKRVYRNQWWISPVVLLDGRVVGIWAHKRQGGGFTLEVQLFSKLARTLRNGIEEEAARLGAFLEAPCRIKRIH